MYSFLSLLMGVDKINIVQNNETVLNVSMSREQRGPALSVSVRWLDRQNPNSKVDNRHPISSPVSSSPPTGSEDQMLFLYRSLDLWTQVTHLYISLQSIWWNKFHIKGMKRTVIKPSNVGHDWCDERSEMPRRSRISKAQPGTDGASLCWTQTITQHISAWQTSSNKNTPSQFYNSAHARCGKSYLNIFERGCMRSTKMHVLSLKLDSENTPLHRSPPRALYIHVYLS